MNWDAIGAVGELVGAAAVVVTLLFLIKQIRSNSALVENSTLQAASDGIGDWARQLTENPDLYRIYRAGLIDDSSLSKEERGLFDLILFQGFHANSSAFLQHRNGGSSQKHLDSLLAVFEATFNTPGGRASWERQKHMLDPDFQTGVENRIAQNNDPRKSDSLS
jgi:hypothetical protein